MGDSKRYDVAISGGGMVGLTLGLALAQNGFRTALIDAQSASAVTDAKFDGRVSAVAFASCRMLKVLGLWDQLAGDAQPINDILVTDGSLRSGASPLFLHFDHRELGPEPLGHLIENRHLRSALIASAHKTDALSYFAPVTVVRAEPNDAETRITLANGETLSAALCIVAEGRRSPLREAAGLKLVQWTYDQSGIVTTVEHEHPHKGIAQEYFLPAGPFAILPMTGNRASLVWTERTDDAKALLATSAESFTAEMRRRFGDHLGTVTPVGPRWSYPLSLQIARAYVAPRLALIGDAAHAIHPIAGQGFNLGLRDIAALTEVLVDARRLGLDIGTSTVLSKYQRWRRFDNLALAAATDMLNRLFSNDTAPLRAARDVGLSIVDRIGPARRMFMRHAGGVFALTPESLPRLLKGETL